MLKTYAGSGLFAAILHAVLGAVISSGHLGIYVANVSAADE